MQPAEPWHSLLAFAPGLVSTLALAVAGLVAPASGIAQELYLRASLLPLLARSLGAGKTAALLTHSAIFAGFHLRTFAAVPSPPVGLLVGAVIFTAGCIWGWQVQRDRTVLWAMVQHSLFLLLMSMFAW